MTISSSSPSSTLETSSAITTTPLNTLNRSNCSYGKSHYNCLAESDASIPHQYLKLTSNSSDVNRNTVVRTTSINSSLPSPSTSSPSSGSTTVSATDSGSAYNIVTTKNCREKLLKSSESVTLVTNLPSLSPQSTILLPNSMPLGGKFILLGKTHKYETPIVRSKEKQNNSGIHKPITTNFDEITSSSSATDTIIEPSTKSLPPRLIPETISTSIQTNFPTAPPIKNSLSSLAHFESHNENDEEYLKNFDNNSVSNCDDDCYLKVAVVLEKETNILNDFNNHTVLSPGIEKFHPHHPQYLPHPQNFFNLQYQQKHQRLSPPSCTEDQYSHFSEKPTSSLPISNFVSTPLTIKTNCLTTNNSDNNFTTYSPTKSKVNTKILKASSSSSSSPTNSDTKLNKNNSKHYKTSPNSTSPTTLFTNITKPNLNFYDNSNSNYFRNDTHLLCNGNGNGNTFLTNDTDFDDTNLRPSSTYILPSTSSSTSSGYPSPSPSPTSFRFLSSLSLLQPSSSGSCNAFLTFCQCWNNLMTRCCFNMPQLKAINVRRCVLALLAITVVTIFYYTRYVDSGVFVGLIHRDSKPPEPIINCRMINGRNGRVVSEAPDHRSEARLRIDAKVLVFVETVYSNLARDIAELLVYNRIKYKIEVSGKSLPVLTNLDKGRYGVIVFENFDKYLNMDKWNRELLDKYCREYSVGIVGFVSSGDENLVAAPLKDFPIYVHTNLHLRDASLNPASPVLRLTRAGETAWGALPGDDWSVFQYNHSSYEPIEWAQRNTQDYRSDSDGGGQIQLPLTTILQDHGYIDGIKRVLFGSGLRFWLHRLVFLDALSYLSHGQLSLSLERMILVDIDDIFVGEKGTRLRPDDVRALVATQKIIASMVPGFRFNLGFSGKYYHHGTREENLGDDYLLQNVQEFNWFSHMWKHQQPHLYDNITLLMAEMQLNYAFANDHNIPTDSGYSISPHHSGVYPAHEILYEAWKKVWNVRVTSTEEYPHLRPARLRRGFVHRNIMVLPRQTCGLFTHTMYIDRYPGGRDKLDESIQGGELFQTIVYNPINIFMTHMSNYGSDRLALYTFQSVIKFLQCWTNLKLASAPPIQLAEMYFKLHPDEIDPVWGNPCDDARHKKIWSKTKNCDSLPKFLVIGPQKTGTTALYTFLSIHPGIASNVPSADTFEEIQFFNGNNYYRGLDWYMDFFPIEPNTTTSATPVHSFIFEKSATYFDGEMVPKRAHALLPHAKIVSILISPAKRAYSWYQHQRAHGDMIANNYSFYQVITASDSAPKGVKDLRNRCLNPGKYAQHLEHWLGYYPAQQLHVIDGEQLRSNPVDVMNDLQRFLKIQPIFDYTNHLRFDIKKGFFCIVVNEKRNKCLGKSKGRQYPSMDERSTKILQRYYQNHNTALVKLLKKLGSRPIPQWLKDDLSTGT